jgi:hypothetical protein
VLETSGAVAQITNDLGFIGFEHVQTKSRGIAVPLDRYHILTLTQRLQAILAIAKDGAWVPEIRFAKLTDAEHIAFTTTVGAAAQRFVFGPSGRAITPHIIKQELPPLVPDPGDLGFLVGRPASMHDKIQKVEDLGRWVDT